MPDNSAAAAPQHTRSPIDVLLCYRGRYREQVDALAHRLRERGLTVTFDREILDAPEAAGAVAADPGAAELNWFSLGDPSVDDDTGWRAPLQQAVGRAYLSVFLFDSRSPSVNVMNEIAWVARAQRNVFFVIDTGASNTSEDYECIVLGMLQSWFGLSRETPATVIPKFGYEFVANDDPGAVQQRLDVLLHRILSYLDRLRSQGLPSLRLDNDLTLAQALDAPLERARRRLRAIQDRFAAAMPAAAGNPAPDRFREILELQLQSEQGARVSGGRLRAPGSPFAYAEASERRRFERTEEIIQRARPGPQESAALFPALARQVATVELQIEASLAAAAGSDAAGFHPAILLGTVPFSVLRSVPLLSQEHDNAIALLNLSFVDFCYQVIKLAVQSWRLTSGQNLVPASFQCRADAIAEVIAARPELADAMHELVRSYCRSSLPRATQGLPPLPYQLPLSLLTAFAERFTIAHGYARLGLLGAAPEDGLQADARAAASVLSSAAEQDQVDPMVALQGCLLAVNADQIVACALEQYRDAPAVQLGDAERRRRERGDALIGAYLDHARGRGMPADAAVDAAAAAREAAEAPLALWQRVEARFAAGIGDDDRPCPVWRPKPAQR